MHFITESWSNLSGEALIHIHWGRLMDLSKNLLSSAVAAALIFVSVPSTALAAAAAGAGAEATGSAGAGALV